jgi:hypothetical protein
MALAASTDAMIPICADQFLALGPDAQAEYASTKVSDRDGLRLRGQLPVDEFEKGGLALIQREACSCQ